MIVLDDNKTEMKEVSETYTDTWDKMVKVEILKRYTTNEQQTIFTMNPDFEAIDIIEPTNETETNQPKYTENYHLENVEKETARAYESVKNGILSFDPGIKINIQKNYISLRKNKNFAYIEIHKKKMNIVIMLSFEGSGRLIKKHKITQLSQRVQEFYNGPCFRVTLENNQNVDEVIDALKEAYKRQS